MKNLAKLSLGSLAIILLSSCSTSEKFVGVARDALPKTTVVSVKAVITVEKASVNEGKLKIEKSTETSTETGAGVFISPTGHILTCAHLFWVEEVTQVTIQDYDGYVYKADLLDKDDGKDLALLKIERPHSDYVRIADPRKLRVGQEVLAIGTPLGREFSVTHGIISALNRDLESMYNLTQSDVFQNPGNSGGPLFNMKGELVGINSGIQPPVNAPIFTGIGFSVQSGQIVEFLTKIRNRYEGLPKYNLKYWK